MNNTIHRCLNLLYQAVNLKKYGEICSDDQLHHRELNTDISETCSVMIIAVIVGSDCKFQIQIYLCVFTSSSSLPKQHFLSHGLLRRYCQI
jgi:hypothetical protein